MGIHTQVTGLWAGYLVLFILPPRAAGENRILNIEFFWGGLENSLNNFLGKTLDSLSPRASGEGGILYTEFREEVCVSHLGGAENAKKSMSPELTD